jgi:hypothetical protein
MREFELTKSKLALFSLPVALCLIIPMILIPLATLEAVSPQGTGFGSFMVGILFVILFLLIMGACFVSAICLIFPSLRLASLISLLICLASAVCFIGGSIAGGSISNHIEKKTLAQLAKRSKPLIFAIKNYEQRFGHPPDSLDTLAPEFIPKVPTTGIGASPDYRFESLTNNSTYGKNPWVLCVHSPTGGPLNFDDYVYLPLQDYSVLSYGDIAWRVGNWAYWHKG